MKKIAIYMGYCTPFNGLNYNDKKLFGTELTVLKVCNLLSKIYDITIYNDISLEEECEHNNIKYKRFFKLNTEIEDIDLVIVVRYINFFTYISCPDKTKVVLWLHDIVCQSSYEGIQFYQYSKHLLNNIKHKINKVVCVSEFHKKFINDFYKLDDNYVSYIYNGITNYTLDKSISKIKNRFIYVSGLDRGLSNLIDYLIILQKTFPDISLVFFKNEELTDDLKIKLLKLANVTSYSASSHYKVIEEFQKSEYFLYPTHFTETFCCAAAEAQLYNNVCIYNKIGSLDNIISDRGLALGFDFDKNILDIINLINNESQKQKYIEDGYNWASKYTYDNDLIKNEWVTQLNEVLN